MWMERAAWASAARPLHANISGGRAWRAKRSRSTSASCPSRRMRWQSLSKDPNAAEVLAARRDALSRARAPNVADRVAYLCDLARGKRVLDVGVVEHFASASASGQWLHGRLCEAAKSCVGVDILEEEIAAIRTRGYDIRVVDLTRQALNEKFELIVMGEIIEHIDAPGALLRNVAAMLADGGVLVLTTPNPWYANVIVKNLGGAVPFTDSADHVKWYDASTLY